MSSNKPAITAYGIDFGTSNSAIAVLRNGTPEVLQLGNSGEATVPSILYSAPGSDSFLIGEDAVAAYLDNGMEGRLLQSIKSLLTLPDTHFGALAERLISTFLRELKSRADRLSGTEVTTAVVGRPVLFSENPDDDRRAEETLAAAVREAGFRECRFLAEPIAAANSFQFEARGSELLFVADLGGGTSDFTLARFHTDDQGQASAEEILGTSGVYIGGDELDSAIVMRRLGNFFGADTSFDWYGKELPFPRHLVDMLARPYLMPKLLRTKVFNTPIGAFLKEIAPRSDTPKAIEHFRAMLDHNLTYLLFAAIEKAKKGLSAHNLETISLSKPSLRIDEEITRPQLDQMTEPEVNKIWNCAQSLLDSTGTRPDQVDRVIMTGGTSLMPAIYERFVAGFGAEKVVRRNAFLSVVEGLALATGSR